ncbi:alanine racemase [Glutamicibacter sp. HZAU]|uniref:alanine racemase n=1 Tax=Glutamicibacter sp. HZAU TaxID=2049891 RepID=UPI000FFBEF96|nr:alanine racemase [Glutamicibacter sp. HZAU]RWZ82052.1 amino acid deaminase/aldolase [Glutamicibacter sp. HZAU]
MKNAQAKRYNHALKSAGISEHPVALLDLDAFDSNVIALRERAGGVPIRIASKSLRVRKALERALDEPGFRGVLCFTLAEALWLASHGLKDLVVAYPQTDAEAISRWAASEQACEAVTLMVDTEEQLDLIDRIAPGHPALKVALELDAAYYPSGNIRIGAARSPLSRPEQVAALAAEVHRRRNFILDGLMGYESQIASVPDGGFSPKALIARKLRQASAAELAERRAETVELVRELGELRFVNAGGTGSVESTVQEPAITEIAAGSGLFAPALFDSYRAFRPAPALYLGFPVVRRPDERTVTILGGGWTASGPAGKDRLPRIEHPKKLRYLSMEGAGEVQTPLTGPSAHRIAIGETVWLRHAKAGEPAERVNKMAVYSKGKIIEQWPTYRGEGKAFL